MDRGTGQMLVKGYKLPVIRGISSGDLIYSVVVINNSEKKSESVSHSVISDSLQPGGL